jgi:hypothetical protein
MATVEEDKDKAKTIAAIDVGDTNDGAGNPDANKDGGDDDGNGNGNGVNACERIGMHTLDASGHGRDPLEGGGGSQLYLN